MKLAKICGFKLKKAQHIVELALLAPFIIFFIGIVYQIAITVQVNYKFNASLYEAISFMATKNKIIKEEDSNISPIELKEKTVNDIKKYTQILLDERRTPNSDSLELKLVNTGDIDFLIGLYKYKSTLNIFNSANPKIYDYITIIPVNSAILRQNSFEIPDVFFETGYTIKPYDNNLTEENNTEKENNNTEDDHTENNENEETNEGNNNDSSLENTENIDIPEVQF